MKKILLIDEDPGLLAQLRRGFRREFQVETVLGHDQVFTAVEGGEEFAVVVNDLRSRDTAGLPFLRRLRLLAPDVACVLLIGDADHDEAVRAVDEGVAFRFLPRTSLADDLAAAVRAAVRLHERRVAERELLEKTVRGCVDTLSEVLSLAAPEVFRRSRRVRDAALLVGRHLELTRLWELEVAALLARVGTVAIPHELLCRASGSEPLPETGAAMLARVPELGAHLLGHIPRLEEVCRTIRHQESPFVPDETDREAVCGARLPVHARVLKVVSDYLEAWDRHGTAAATFSEMRRHASRYDPEILAAAERCLGGAPDSSATRATPTKLRALELEQDRVLAADAVTRTGLLIAPSGTPVGIPLLHRLRNFAALGNLREPLEVLPTPGEVR